MMLSPLRSKLRLRLILRSLNRLRPVTILKRRKLLEMLLILSRFHSYSIA
jgi:hypothetical protein